MSEHAPLAPSSAEQWGNCPGSVRAQAEFPDVETEAAREGTAAHWAAACVLMAQGETTCSAFVGQRASNGIVIDEDMADAAQLYVDDVAAVCSEFNAWDRLRVEQRVHMPLVHRDNWGTPDAWLFLRERGELYIWDFKYGHRSVVPEGNLQLIDYASGIAEAEGIDGHHEQHVRVIMRIAQPRCYDGRGPVREWSGMLPELRPYWNRLATAAEEATNGSARLNSGDWCRDCKAVGVCAAARRAGYNTVHVAGQSYEMDAMTGAQLAAEREVLLSGKRLLDARLGALEDILTHRLRAGEQGIPLVLKSEAGREQWSAPVEQVLAFAQMFGVDAAKPGVKTPKQTRDSAPSEVKPLLEEAMKAITERKPPKLKLIPAEQSRASRIFRSK